MTTPALNDDLVRRLRSMTGLKNVHEAAAALETLAAENAALRSALEPFAAGADARKSKDWRGAVCFNQSLLIVARTALKGA